MEMIVNEEDKRVKFKFTEKSWIEIFVNDEEKNELIIYTSRALAIFPRGTNSVILKEENPFTF